MNIAPIAFWPDIGGFIYDPNEEAYPRDEAWQPEPLDVARDCGTGRVGRMMREWERIYLGERCE